MVEWMPPILWGFFGGFVIDGMEFHSKTKENGGVVPQMYRNWGFWLGEFVRLLAGGGVACAAWGSNQVNGWWAFMVLGAATPSIAERLTKAGQALFSENTTDRREDNDES